MKVAVECLLPEGAHPHGWTQETDQSIKTQVDGFNPVCLSVVLDDNSSAAIKLASLYQNIIKAGACADDTCGISVYDNDGNLISRTPNCMLKERAA